MSAGQGKVGGRGTSLTPEERRKRMRYALWYGVVWCGTPTGIVAGVLFHRRNFGLSVDEILSWRFLLFMSYWVIGSGLVGYRFGLRLWNRTGGRS